MQVKVKVLGADDAGSTVDITSPGWRETLWKPFGTIFDVVPAVSYLCLGAMDPFEDDERVWFDIQKRRSLIQNFKSRRYCQRGNQMFPLNMGTKSRIGLSETVFCDPGHH